MAFWRNRADPQRLLPREIKSFFHALDIGLIELGEPGVLVVCGIDEHGFREVLGYWVAESDSEASWCAVFAELKERRLHGVPYVMSDDRAGMVKAIGMPRFRRPARASI